MVWIGWVGVITQIYFGGDFRVVVGETSTRVTRVIILRRGRKEEPVLTISHNDRSLQMDRLRDGARGQTEHGYLSRALF